MKNMMITEAELMNVTGGLSPEEMDSLMDMKMKLFEMLDAGKITPERFSKEMERIEEMLRRPGCVFTS